MGPSRGGACHGRFVLSVVSLLAAVAAGCGARTGAVFDPPEGRPRPVPRAEVCNGLDDDLDGLVAVGAIDAGSGEGGVLDGGFRIDAGMDGGGALDAGGFDAGSMDASAPDAGTTDVDRFVDEDFRDELGRYVHVDHCGGCGRPCRLGRPHELEVACGLVAESPSCIAVRCEEGFVPSRSGVCVSLYERLCLPCADDGDCGDFDGASCADVGDERRCAIDCALLCPSGYACTAGVCAPSSGSCTCEVGADFDLACALEDPDGNRCPGSATCRSGVLSECVAPEELCDHEDDDCNGMVDDGFRDSRGAYSLDIHHCGECGIDCTLSMVPEGDLVCGGDPFAPTCVLHCPDTDDGLDIGDRIDADRDIATGCECTLSSLTDEPGPVRTSGSMLDVNCDGADGVVVESFYVAEDGNDSAPGSPTRPLRTLAVAMERALASLATGAPRPHVFVASGTYTETLELADGVRVHGGYRRDFLSLDPSGFRVEIRAPSGGTAPGGAAVVVRGAGTRETVLEWVSVRGLDATAPGEATFGLYALDPGPLLVLRDLEVHAGAAGEGVAGMRGTAGASMTAPPMEGEIPRGAIEDAAHACLPGGMNTVRGGAGGRNTCGGLDTRGGDGGAASCPAFAMFQGAGANAASVRGVPGGAGGAGGQDSNGPITSDTGACAVAVCCGLADFSVPTDFMGPQPGRAGREGTNGAPGGACTEPFGRFVGDAWEGMDATGGTDGAPGSGGGGGGAGGGAVMDWFDGVCEFADGIGGGGGGGGAGGCGGAPGTGGTSGAPSVAILVRYTSAPTGSAGPTIRGATIAPSEGGRGGDGGAGGEGGRGLSGAFGGTIPREDRSTPTLSGPFPGGRGGTGGSGGAGGGGGGGCGGASVGIWVTGLSSEPPFVAAWRTGNTFLAGAAGSRGRGGGGPAAGADGAEGGSSDVLVR